MGGEKLGQAAQKPLETGSPPRGRGKVFNLLSVILFIGITPAWAGKRQCMTTETTQHNGSPPRGRGKVFCVSLCIDFLRITPAWAGKSHIFKPFRFSCGDHPRVGGEKYKIAVFGGEYGGSPPRGRGKVLPNAPVWLPHRITPAWAGKSVRKLMMLAKSWDHPRVGGEKTKKIP